MTRRTRAVLLFFAASAVVIFLYIVRGVLTPFALAAAIAYLVSPLVRAFESRQIPRSAAILLSYLVLGVVVGVAIYLVIPLLVRELNDVTASLPQNIASLERYLNGGLRWFSHVPGPIPLDEMAAAAVQKLEQLVTFAASRTIDVLFSLFSRAFNLVLAPFLAFYLLRDLELIRRSALSVVPVSAHDELIALFSRLNRVGTGFIRGQLIVSGFVTLLITAGLAALGVKYALLIGVLGGVFDVIPYFGPLIGGLPAVLLGLMRSPSTAVWAAIWIFTVHQIEGTVLQPRIMGDHVGLHPLTVIFAILAGGSLLGIWGMLIAVPTAATVKVVGTYTIEKLSNV